MWGNHLAYAATQGIKNIFKNINIYKEYKNINIYKEYKNINIYKEYENINIYIFNIYVSGYIPVGM